MFPGTIRVAVLRFLWAPGPPVPDQMPHLMWPQQLYDVIFWSPNGWSLRDYWQRVTFGLMDLQFDLDNVVWWRLDDRDQASLMHDRGGIMAACRQAAEEGGHSLAGYDRVVAFVHAPPCDAGALSEFGDVVFDQNKTLEELQHEIGHLLGFQHAWGPQGVYKDPYCVMGETGPFDHSIPPAPEAAGVTMLKPFWRSGRRVSAASLYRLFSSPSLGGRGGIASGVGAAGYFDVYVFHGQLGQSIWLTALSESKGKEQVLAVVPIEEGGVLALEYRNNTGDDEGVAPAVVAHTIGTRSIGIGHHEVDPVWFETTVSPVPGAQAAVLQRIDLAGHPFGGYWITVENVESGGGPARVQVSVN